jgi:hypothetical protein
MKTNRYNLAAACVLNGIMFGIAKLFYEVVPVPMHNLLYCSFLGFTVTSATNPEMNSIPKLLASMGAGLVWVGGYILFEYMFLKLPITPMVSKAVAFGLMSFLIEVLNTQYLRKTPFQCIPLQFAVVIAMFSQQCHNIMLVLVALIIGVIMALLSKRIYMRLG